MNRNSSWMQQTAFLLIFGACAVVGRYAAAQPSSNTDDPIRTELQATITRYVAAEEEYLKNRKTLKSREERLALRKKLLPPVPNAMRFVEWANAHSKDQLAFEGLLLIVVAAFVGAVGLVAIKRVRDLEPLELQAWLAWGSVPLLLPLTLLLEDGQLASLTLAGFTGWSALLYSALLASLIAHTSYFALIRRYPVSTVAPVTVLTPLFSVLFSVLLLGDTLDGRMLIGALLTLSGVTVILARERSGAAART